jgi:hypothetical protein
MICPYCENYNDGDGQFCGHCGLKLRPDLVESSYNEDSQIVWESQNQAYPGIFREDYPNYPPEALLDRPEYHYPQQESKRKQRFLTILIIALSILLISVIAFFLLREKQSKQLALEDLNSETSMLTEEETEKDNLEINPDDEDKAPIELTITPNNIEEDKNTTELSEDEQIPGLLFINTILEPNSDQKFGGLGDGMYALIENENRKVWVYTNDGIEIFYHDLASMGYCEEGIYSVRFDPYNPQFIVPCSFEIVRFYHGQTDWVEQQSTGALEGLYLTKNRIFTKNFYSLYSEGELIADATGGNFPGRLGLSDFAKFSVSSDGNYIGTQWQDYPDILKVWSPGGLKPLYQISDVTKRPAFSFDGCEIATINSKGNINLWECQKGSFIKELSLGNTVDYLVYGRGNKLAAVLENDMIIILNPQNEQKLVEIDSNLFNRFYFSPQLDYLVGVDKEGFYRLYQIDY